jgi:uncharacterized protein involved in oxidation of intracellular sulfur
MKARFILNGPPYGSELTYNALRLANALAKREHNEVRAYLMGDAVLAAKRGRKVPDGLIRDIPPRPADMDTMVRANLGEAA